MFGCILRGGVPGEIVVCWVPVKIYGLLGPVAVHKETYLYNR